ncbi:MAG TPA: manganese catalase family protein [Vicinamibacterales bacterium]|jgi:Mn-containing catalase
MFHHVKELQYNARVSGPDPRFAGLLLEQFGGGNGELKAAMQYFVQAFGIRRSYPDKYDLLMDIATEEFSHLEIVGATITMLLDGINGELKNAAERSDLSKLLRSPTARDEAINDAMISPQFLVLSGGGPALTNCQGTPWSGSCVNANGDLTVDLRSDIGAESRAKIVYEYLLQFTEDPYVHDSLRFLMTREIAHMQMFQAALESIEPNFPPGVLQGDPRYTHLYFNMSDTATVRGQWNRGQGPWPEGEEWQYVESPRDHVVETSGLVDQEISGTTRTENQVQELDRKLSRQRHDEVARHAPNGAAQWSSYPQKSVESPERAQ